MSEPIDDLNEAIREAEDALADLNLGVTAEVPFAGGALIWGKDGGDWMLRVRFADGTLVPLLKAGKRHRTQAPAALADLHTALLAAVDAEAKEIAEATRLARGFVQVLAGTCSAEHKSDAEPAKR